MGSNEEFKDYYATLGLSPDVDQKEISKAYRRLIKETHPDAPGVKNDSTAGRRVAELVEAWRILGDQARREAYDRARSIKARNGQASAGRAAPEQPSPRIEFQPACLDFGQVKHGEIVTGYVNIFNRGGPAISLDRLGDCPEWLLITLPPNDDCILHFPLTLKVRVDTTRLLPRRRYSAEIAIRISGWSPQSSTVGVLNITLAVAADDSPKLVVRPAGWIIEPWETEGAPRSLIFHCTLSNEGGGTLAGELETPRWVQVEPRNFGPLNGGHSSQRALVQVDREAWVKQGSPEGTLWISSKEGDGKKVSILTRDQRENRAVSWAAGAVAAIGIGPVLILLAALPSAAWALILAACLALPALLDSLRRWNWCNVGIPDIAPGWDLGPIGDRVRLLLTGALWATIGAVLGYTADEILFIELPGQALSLAGATMWAWCWLTISIRDGRKRMAERWVEPFAPLIYPTLAMATVAAWGLSTGIAFHQLSGQWFGNALEIGASAGWAFGVLVVFARSNALFPKWRLGIDAMLWNTVPVLTAIYGLSISLILFDLVAPSTVLHTNGASISELPIVSLAMATAAVIAAAGLLSGFLVGVLTILPSGGRIEALAGSTIRYDRYLVTKIIASVERVFEDYAFRNNSDRLIRDVNGRSPLAVHYWKLPISMLLVGSLIAAVLVYAIANLVFATVAFLGIVTG